ncbi:MAG: acyltransferase [Thermomonas sp.]|uniref:acyltransferase family protein n=1 Tax=Thermomonas sp. TaxID=1971895 RepID=UPI0031BB6D96|nr:acyltransferase [Thermomonas sp.]
MFGQSGVDLFFVLSGFLITRILLETAGKEGYYRTFYARRILRIFPLYFAYLGVHFFLLPYLLDTGIPAFNSQVWSWLFLENVAQSFPVLASSGPNHYWSLAVEEHFYLMWPLVVASFDRRTLLRIIGGILLVSPVLRYVLASQGYGVFYLTPTRLDGLSLGAGIAILLADHREAAPVWMVTLSRALCVTLPLLLLPLFVKFSGSGHALLQAMKLSLIPLLCAAVVALCLIDVKITPLRRILETRWLRWIGGISYGLYVFHPACFRVVAKLLPGIPLPGTILLAFGTSFLVAWVSFRWFESRFLSLKRYFILPSHPRPVGAYAQH